MARDMGWQRGGVVVEQLTDRAIRSMNAERRLDVWDEKVTGLVLRLTPKGTKTWAVFYRFRGQQRRYTLGSWRADASRGASLSLAQARDEAERILAMVRLGPDPQAVKLDERAAATVKALEERRVKAEGGPLTVERLLALCLADLRLKPKTEREWRRLAAVRDHPEAWPN